jgi:poly [ADP-ribose] polymerase
MHRYMFGKGVYFADIASKSANYCWANRQNDVGVVLLCEVALGTPLERTEALFEAPSQARKRGLDSTFGKGQTVPAADQAVVLAPEPRPVVGFKYGEKHADSFAQSIIPSGTLEEPEECEDSDLLYNEYVVYDTQQVRLAYAVRLKFNYV